MTEITDHQRLTIVKHLAAGRDIPFVAKATLLEAEEVRQIAQSHGYPDPAKLAWAVDKLTEKARAQQAAAATAPAPIVPPAAGPTPRHHQVRPVSAPAPRPEPQHADDIAALIQKASKSERKRTQALGEKVAGLVEQLRERVEAESEEAQERARQAAEDAKEKARRERERQEAAEEVRLLEQRLADAKKKLRGAGGKPRASAPASASGAPDRTKQAEAARQRHQRLAEVLDRHGVTADAIRGWAREEGLDVKDSGMLPGSVVDAYDKAHGTEAA